MCFSYELLWLTCVRSLAFSINLITIDELYYIVYLAFVYFLLTTFGWHVPDRRPVHFLLMPYILLI